MTCRKREQQCRRTSLRVCKGAGHLQSYLILVSPQRRAWPQGWRSHLNLLKMKMAKSIWTIPRVPNFHMLVCSQCSKRKGQMWLLLTKLLLITITNPEHVQKCPFKGNSPPENASVHSIARGERGQIWLLLTKSLLITIKFNPVHAQNVHSMATYHLRMHLFTVQQVEKGQMWLLLTKLLLITIKFDSVHAQKNVHQRQLTSWECISSQCSKRGKVKYDCYWPNYYSSQ